MGDYKPRPTMYRGIKMRSRLEADFAQYLDSVEAEWSYEPTCFAGPIGQWLPDFRAESGNSVYYVEVKPENFLERPNEEIDDLLARMEVAWLSEPSVYLHMVPWKWTERAPSGSLFGHPGSRLWFYQPPGAINPTRRQYIWPGRGQLDRLISSEVAED